MPLFHHLHQLYFKHNLNFTCFIPLRDNRSWTRITIPSEGSFFNHKCSLFRCVGQCLCYNHEGVFVLVKLVFLFPLTPQTIARCLLFMFCTDFEFLAYPLNQYIFLFDGCSMSMGCKFEMSYINIFFRRIYSCTASFTWLAYIVYLNF